MQKTPGHIVVAMSGGVDSSATAALLLEQGYKVTGMMMRLWADSTTGQSQISDSIASSSKVADTLGIPLHIINAQEYFYENVVQYFISEYAEGNTPNPCILCNRLLKWGLFLEHAVDLGANFMATGHYAQIMPDEKGLVHLYRGKDVSKDQSYVLGFLSQEQLQKTIFPLGMVTKEQARLIAKKYLLPVEDRPESQDLCFVKDKSYKDFLKRYSPTSFQPGKIVTKSGKIIGQHSGLASYTIGQRKGILIADREPYYVIEKNIHENTLIVGKAEESDSECFTIKHFNWTSGKPIKNEFTADVMIRYRAKAISSQVKMMSNSLILVQLSVPMRDITPGQLAVVYKGEEVIGAGFIQQEVKK